jgi:acyl CoA:acetate/3-ketoacid CoA transferase alpha subunit
MGERPSRFGMPLSERDMNNKIFDSLQVAVDDGTTLVIGSFGTAGMPSELIDALIARGAGDLTIVNNAGSASAFDFRTIFRLAAPKAAVGLP